MIQTNTVHCQLKQVYHKTDTINACSQWRIVSIPKSLVTGKEMCYNVTSSISVARNILIKEHGARKTKSDFASI